MLTSALRVFYETVRLGSIRKAGIELGLSPSSVSRQIAIFEHQIGTTLFDRSSRGVALNHSGELVAEFARNVLLDYDTLRVDLDDYKGGRRALIRIAAVESVVAAAPAAAVASFRVRFPQVQFDLRIMPAPAVVEAVVKGETDIGLGFSPETNPELETKLRVQEPLMLVSHVDAATDLKPVVSLADMSALDLALPGRDFGFRRLLDSACRDAGFNLSAVFTSNAFEALRDFAVHGGGHTVLPSRALLGKDNSMLHVARIEDKRLPKTTIDLLVKKKRKMSRILNLFLQELGAKL